MTRRLLHALAALYALVAVGLAHCAVVSWQNGSWPHAAFFAGAAVLLAVAIVHHSYQRDELRFAHARLERDARLASFEDGVVAVALAAACCETWWTSCGFQHDSTCPHRHRSAA
ncbi:hypothetical protein [Streptomyces sp. KR55]|uniref:hypothetical protein n=1 Tax=Streptomyces sp. KR55 TaxID=3457425 RepID=UPI003FD00C11